MSELVNIFICGLIFLVLVIYNKVLSKKEASPLVNFIASFILIYLHIFLDNRISEHSYFSMIYKLLIILSTICFLILCFRDLQRISVKTLKFRETLSNFSFLTLYLSLIPLSFMSKVGIYFLIGLELSFFGTLLFANWPALMSRSIRYEYNRGKVNYYRNIRGLSDFPISLYFLLESLIYEFKTLRKTYFKLKSLFYIMIAVLFFLALLSEYRFLNNEFSSIGYLFGFTFVFYFLILLVKFLITAVYLSVVYILSLFAKWIKQNNIGRGIVITVIFFSFFSDTSVALYTICFIISALLVGNIYSLNKNKYKFPEDYLNYRIAEKLVKKVKKLTDSSSRKTLTFYIAASLSIYTWFISLIGLLLIFNAPKGHINIVIYVLLIPLVYYTLRVVMYFKINEIWFLAFFLLSSFGIFILNVSLLDGLSLILINHKVPATIFKVRTELVLTGIEYLLLIIITVKATTLRTIDALKRALTILFTITTTCFIVFKFIPYIVFSEVEFKEGDLKFFQLVSNFSFIPSLIGTLIGTIYVDIVKRKHEEIKKKEENRALKALIYKSSLARPLK
ncbi:hypothetical protein KM927_25140 [Priestia megaterium]|uniref:hypothetical protein n=1 Tax=Priestia megaterium TaxID=1404 RepID=UPI001C234467|nr:hypothetical protein [Priestia megaterium]MBU8756767.1 hypothetical protein [Priestia megaterium]